MKKINVLNKLEWWFHSQLIMISSFTPTLIKLSFKNLPFFAHFCQTPLPSLTLFPMGGGKFAPPAENRPFSVEKMKIFKNGWTEKLITQTRAS